MTVVVEVTQTVIEQCMCNCCFPPVVFVCRDKRAKADPKDYMIDGQNGETFYKLPGSLNGQQFIIQNCEVR